MVSQLMRKHIELEAKGMPLEIMSVFTRENLPGYIYVESKKMAHVKKAIENVTGIYEQTVKVVPIDDMVACLRLKVKEKDVKEGAWVRVKRGKYGGDLAKVVFLLSKKKTVLLNNIFLFRL
jgi:transcription elongation factor SPT5